MIRTLIVMATYGQIFYNKEDFFGRQAGETDISLTAGLISAIYNMTTETQQQKITELELENDRSVFRELPGEKLFIITVDKRMDTDDADDMLDDLVVAFGEKYGDMVMDGMILNDFEPKVNEIVEERLWYNTIDRKVNIFDIVGFLAVFAAMIFYPIWLLGGEEYIINPLKSAISEGIVSLLIESLRIGLITITPLLILIMLSKYTKVEYLFRFAMEFIRRPTRGGYAEQLPTWFMVFPIAIIGSIVAIVRVGRGVQYALTLQLWPKFYEPLVESAETGETLLWEGVYYFLFFYAISWFIIFPLIIGIVTGDVSKRWLKSSTTIIGYSTLIHLPTHIIGGVVYNRLVGFHPEDLALFNLETTTLPYLFIVTLPGNLFLFLYFYYLATGLNQLVTKNRERYPIGLVIAFFVILGIQNLLVFILFRTNLYGPLF